MRAWPSKVLQIGDAGDHLGHQKVAVAIRNAVSSLCKLGARGLLYLLCRIASHSREANNRHNMAVGRNPACQKKLRETWPFLKLGRTGKNTQKSLEDLRLQVSEPE
jgi:hypothetical protein